MCHRAVAERTLLFKCVHLCLLAIFWEDGGVSKLGPVRLNAKILDSPPAAPLLLLSYAAICRCECGARSAAFACPFTRTSPRSTRGKTGGWTQLPAYGGCLVRSLLRGDCILKPGFN